MASGSRRAIVGVFLMLAVLLGGTAAQAGSRTETSVTVQVFYDELEPYGRWVDHRIYGIVWVPASGRPDWHPYTYGRWVWTADYGWYWDSDEEFGWATYHYGRWVLTSDYGWVWVPDDVWGPGWVEWRYRDGYVGWSPMTPESRWERGALVSARVDTASPRYQSSWVFVSDGDFARGEVRSRRVPKTRNREMLEASVSATSYTTVNGHVFSRGVDVKRLSAATKVKIAPTPVKLSEQLAAGTGSRAAGSVTIYRPRMLAKSNLDLSVPGGQEELPWKADTDVIARERITADPPLVGAEADHPVGTKAFGGIGGSADRAPAPSIGIGSGIGIGGGGGLRIGR